MYGTLFSSRGIAPCRLPRCGLKVNGVGRGAPCPPPRGTHGIGRSVGRACARSHWNGASGQVPARSRSRRGRNGRRLHGHPPQPGRVRRQDAPPGALAPRRYPHAVSSRGIRRQLGEAPRRRRRARRRRGRGRRGVPRDGAARRGASVEQLAGRAAAGSRWRTCAIAVELLDVLARRARAGNRPPRHQAGEPLRARETAGQGARLRHRPGARRPGGARTPRERACCSGRPPSWPPSRRSARRTRSTPGPTLGGGCDPVHAPQRHRRARGRDDRT